MRVRLPNCWKPRDYQRKAWDYLERGGKHAELIWHRRSGKDELGLHYTAVAAFERPATYWYMLPLANQARKAVWDAINPHTGKRRIDEAFPRELRETTRENDMMIRFINGATWQVVGSDNYTGMIGSPPAGIVYSEWALSKPAAKAYLRPIIAENNGWQLFNTTPRGNNHAAISYNNAKLDPKAFAQKLTVLDTGVLSAEQIAEERQEYVNDYGAEEGLALFDQEWMCSFNAPMHGSYYGRLLSQATEDGRITTVNYDPELSVSTAWDLGYTDATAIWFFQAIAGELHILDYYEDTGKDVRHYADVVQAKGYKYRHHWLPHDAKAKTLASGGRSIEEQLREQLGSIHIVPSLSLQDGIQAVRMALPLCWFDETRCEDGLATLHQYHREYDVDRKVFKDRPEHDWASHGADAFRYLAIAYKTETIDRKLDKTIKKPTLNELLQSNDYIKRRI